MIFTAKQIYDGAVKPLWYYGFSYREWFSEREVWLPIPWNFIVRWRRYARMRWDAWRGRDDSVHRRIRRMAMAQFSRAYEKGIEHGQERAIHAMRVMLSKAEGYSNG